MHACLGKLRVSCRRATLTQIHKGVANGSKEEFEQSIDFRVDGISDDDIYKDEQYMHRTCSKICNN